MRLICERLRAVFAVLLLGGLERVLQCVNDPVVRTVQEHVEVDILYIVSVDVPDQLIDLAKHLLLFIAGKHRLAGQFIIPDVG